MDEGKNSNKLSITVKDQNLKWELKEWAAKLRTTVSDLAERFLHYGLERTWRTDVEERYRLHLIRLELKFGEAEALAQLCKDIKLEDCQRHARDNEEAGKMFSGIEQLRIGLEHEGWYTREPTFDK